MSFVTFPLAVRCWNPQQRFARLHSVPLRAAHFLLLLSHNRPNMGASVETAYTFSLSGNRFHIFPLNRASWQAAPVEPASARWRTTNQRLYRCRVARSVCVDMRVCRTQDTGQTDRQIDRQSSAVCLCPVCCLSVCLSLSISACRLLSVSRPSVRLSASLSIFLSVPSFGC